VPLTESVQREGPAPALLPGTGPPVSQASAVVSEEALLWLSVARASVAAAAATAQPIKGQGRLQGSSVSRNAV
jgi:hypothetical protein